MYFSTAFQTMESKAEAVWHLQVHSKSAGILNDFSEYELSGEVHCPV